MSIQKKSLISNLNTTRKAIVASSPAAPAAVNAGVRIGTHSALAKKTGTHSALAKKTGTHSALAKKTGTHSALAKRMGRR
jgi:hypothetical protein